MLRSENPQFVDGNSPANSSEVGHLKSTIARQGLNDWEEFVSISG